MKADTPKRKIFSDAVDLLVGDPPAGVAAGGGVEMLDINGIRPFHGHPFHLYEGERLDDMVESIKEHGILNPVIVRKMHYGYEMLSGHNSQNAGKLAGLTQIPAIVKENLSDADAYVYVIETNLMQRSFTDLSISEKAAVQLSYLPEQAQKLALEASEKSGVVINKDIAAKVRKAPMTEKAILEAIAGKQPEVDPVLGVVEEKPAPKPIKLSAGIREKYFQDTDPKQVEAIIDKALAAWFKKKR